MKNKKCERPKEQVRAERIFYIIQACCLLIAFGLFFIDWHYTIVAVGVLAWNGCFYTSGCKSQIIDEYEWDSYPQSGLVRMYQSWTWLVVCLILVYFFVFKD